MSKQFTNDLINESSPYLLQHAHNPVAWKAWNDTTLAQAKKENKLILVSIGYAACHWCHVMEHESFKDERVAQTMNAHFINIKVDREERPDIDQVYMNAVQLMTGHGGWPLNAVALPDGRPVWGSTYVKKDEWIRVLEQLAKLYQDTPEKLHEYADRLQEGMQNMDLVVANPGQPDFSLEFINDTVSEWSRTFDTDKGGFKRAPKFMLPNNYHFLLRHAYQNEAPDLMDYVNTTLTKMAFGGIYDHIGGGFSRYSVDDKWHVPHFEKMLYDNAQLVSLYADAYKTSKNELYKTTVYETIAFVERELMLEPGIFYSSLDADSLDEKGVLEEGAFYVWSKSDLEALIKDDFDLFCDYYNINQYGYWENNHFVLIRSKADNAFCKEHKLDDALFKSKKNKWKTTLFEARKKRPRPRLDDKTLTSWNAMMLKGYVDAYKAFNDDSFLQMALKSGHFLSKQQINSEGGLYRSFKNGKSTINGYLIDYATTIDAFLGLYEVSADETWLNAARNLTNYSFDNFFDDDNTMFFFTSKKDASLVTRNVDYRDNVIASSNSIMAKNLFKLSHYFSNSSYLKTATQMLNNIKPEIINYPSGYSNWLDLMLNYTNPFYEIAVVGKQALQKSTDLWQHYLPNTLLAVSTVESNLPLTKNRFLADVTRFYVCVDNTCQLPTESIPETLEKITF